MAESTLAVTYSDLEAALQTLSGNAGLDCDTLIQQGYRYFLYPHQLAEVSGKSLPVHRWTFLTQQTTLAIGSPTTGTATSVAGTVTATSGIFKATMVGCTMTVTDYSGTDDLETIITGFTSATVVTVASTTSWAAKAISVSSTYRYELPDNFGSLRGEITYPASTPYGPIEIVSESRIRHLREDSTYTSNPVCVAIVPRSPAGTYDPEEDGTRYDLWFYPTPSTAYSLTLAFDVKVDKLDETTNKYPLGGLDHAETVRQCCLAAYELTHHDKAGTQTSMAMNALVSSILRDQRQMAPQRIGRVVDPRFLPRGRSARLGEYVYVDGVRMIENT
jgi:hypothetical protein